MLGTYHPCQRDDANKFAPLSSAVVRANMQDRLMEGRGSYRERFEMVTRMNPEVVEVIRRHTVSARNQGRYERSRSLFGYNDDSDTSDTEEEAATAGVYGTVSFGREVRNEMRWAQNHARTCEFLMCLMLRWDNMHSHCSILYALSQSAHCAQQASNQGFDAPDRPQHHGASGRTRRAR